MDMNVAIQEIYRLVLASKWVITDQRQIDDIRIVMISVRKKPAVPRAGVISRNGKKLQGLHSYPSKVFYFNTATGEASALSMVDLQNIDYQEFMQSLEDNIRNNPLVTNEVLL